MKKQYKPGFDQFCWWCSVVSNRFATSIRLFPRTIRDKMSMYVISLWYIVSCPLSDPVDGGPLLALLPNGTCFVCVLGSTFVFL